MFTIYCITNILNGKKYYGQTIKTLKKRWQEHLCSVRSNNKCFHLHKAIKKYGEHNFDIKLIEEVTTKQAANEREMFYINKDNTLKEGYNLTKGGEGTVGRKVSEEEKARKLASFKKTMEKKGGFSEEHKQKLSEAKKGKPGANKGKMFSEEHKANLRKAREVSHLKIICRKDNYCGVKGVTILINGKYRVRIDGKHIGCYSTIEEATEVYIRNNTTQQLGV